MRETGLWGLRLLLLTLCVSPLRQWSGRQWFMQQRRMLGLFAFFYACIHLAAFAHFYIGWQGALLLEEVLERPYISLGFAAWLLMLPLTLTSSRRAQRRLRRQWLRLHRLVYPAAILACLHLLWQSRSDVGEALMYIGLCALLLGWRIRRAGRRQAGRAPL
ncbi:sulfoxide reductase heme-binding subunit YedZ [Kineobactrum salinum]|uniref:Sulfoxide reductase heme-binding subunit YedZ n=2 Tax=Kineobactrum salinum TaxID=2708301 RepID=A0A6C0U6I7_9GAMM|nr:sulfoxide reductase heme-binding subunit YedZ [Kineobactrum salinum]